MRRRASTGLHISGAAATLRSGSIGISLCPEHGADLTGLMKAADIAMYEAKASGRSRMCIFDAGLARACDERIAAEAVLREVARDGV